MKDKKGKEITNCKDLWGRLSDVFNGLEDGTLEHKTGAEMNNTAGKMINLARTNIDYYALKKEAPTIPFLECTEDDCKK